jgi:imidazolonepropionase
MDLLLVNCGPIWTPSAEHDHRMQRLEGDALLIRGGRIEAHGSAAALRGGGLPETDARGALVLPGFVDSHTHPVFFETREEEYELRNAGRSYLEIQQAGGGIFNSRRRLMEADPAELKQRVRARLRRFLALGTTTIEAKSGYGLTVEHELLSLRILAELAAGEPLGLHATLLAAHSVPPEYAGDRGEWFRQIEEEILPVVAAEGLAEFIDAFCEPGVISLDESRRVLEAGRRFGLRGKLHADQLEAGGGGALAAECGALSADHLECIDEAGLQAMVAAGTIFALLPGSTYFLGQEHWAPARRILAAGGRIALCSDYNPGSSHIQSMPFILSLATCRLKMSAEEAIWAATRGGALALGRDGELGQLAPGRAADLCLWPFRNLAQLPYTCGDNRPLLVFKEGRPVAGSWLVPAGEAAGELPWTR